MTGLHGRRQFLKVLGFATGAAAAPVAAGAVVRPAIALAPTAVPPPESLGHFKHPAEYLAAMQAIGWQPVAMFQRLEDGSHHRMGVSEDGGDEDHVARTWTQFHAISMRCPANLQIEGRDNDWWKAVWHHLYDLGYRRDVSP